VLCFTIVISIAYVVVIIIFFFFMLSNRASTRSADNFHRRSATVTGTSSSTIDSHRIAAGCC